MISRAMFAWPTLNTTLYQNNNKYTDHVIFCLWYLTTRQAFAILFDLWWSIFAQNQRRPKAHIQKVSKTRENVFHQNKLSPKLMNLKPGRLSVKFQNFQKWLLSMNSSCIRQKWNHRVTREEKKWHSPISTLKTKIFQRFPRIKSYMNIIVCLTESPIFISNESVPFIALPAWYAFQTDFTINYCPA